MAKAWRAAAVTMSRGFRSRRDDRDRHLGRHRATLDSVLREGDREADAGRRGPGLEHRIQPVGLDVRDHGRLGRDREAVVDLDVAAVRQQPAGIGPLVGERPVRAGWDRLVVVWKDTTGSVWPTSSAAARAARLRRRRAQLHPGRVAPVRRRPVPHYVPRSAGRQRLVSPRSAARWSLGRTRSHSRPRSEGGTKDEGTSRRSSSSPRWSRSSAPAAGAANAEPKNQRPFTRPVDARTLNEGVREGTVARRRADARGEERAAVHAYRRPPRLSRRRTTGRGAHSSAPAAIRAASTGRSSAGDRSRC